MSNSEIIVTRQSDVAINNDTDPLETRWGLNPTQREKHLNAHECGIALVPFARFFPIKRFASPRENHSIDWTQDKERIEIISAQAAQNHLEEALGGKGAQSRINWGLVVGFKRETDAAKMEVITQTLLPQLSSIRAICAEFGYDLPISEVCEGSDEIEGNREMCLTCWKQWLESNACTSYMEEVRKEGMEVVELDAQTGERIPRSIRPTAAEFSDAYTLARRAFAFGYAAVSSEWSRISNEIEKNLRDDVSPYEHGFRKDLHQHKPQDRQFALLERNAKLTSAAQTAGNQGTNAVLAMLAESQAAQVAAQAQTNQLLAQMAANLMPPPVDEVKPKGK